MSDRPFPTQVSLSPNEDYTGPMQGTTALSWKGPSHAIFLGFTKKFGKTSPHHPQFGIRVQLTDEDCRGAQIIGTKAVDGKDVNGQDLSRNVEDMFVSAGLISIEQINAIRAAQKAGTMAKWDFDQVIATLTGKPCVVEVGESYDEETGKAYSNIDNFITEAQYAEKAKTPQLFRQARQPPTPGGNRTANAGGGAAGAMGIPMMGGGKPGALSPVQAPLAGMPGAQPALGTVAQPAGGFVLPGQAANGGVQAQPSQVAGGILGLANMGTVPPKMS